MCVCVRVCVCVYTQVESGEYLTLADRLRNSGLTHITHLHIECPPDCADKARALRASLTVARALSCLVYTLGLSTWPVTASVVSELRGLPQWHSTLEFNFESPGKPGAACAFIMARAAQLIPRTYHAWDVSDCDCTDDELTALVSAVPSDRTAEAPLSIVVRDLSAIWVVDVLALMAESESFPHVTVEQSPEYA